jgi:hypothetical protein
VFPLWLSCFRAASGSMPGIFSPGLIGRIVAFGLIPGAVVLPNDLVVMLLGAGIPGVVFAVGCIGEVENPGGKLALLTTTAFAFVAEFVFVLDELQAAPIETPTKRQRNILLDIG